MKRISKALSILILSISLIAIFSCNNNASSGTYKITINSPQYLHIYDNKGNIIDGKTITINKGESFEFSYKQKTEEEEKYSEFYDLDRIIANGEIIQSDNNITKTISITEDTDLEFKDEIYILGQMIDRNKTYGEVEYSNKNNQDYYWVESPIKQVENNAITILDSYNNLPTSFCKVIDNENLEYVVYTGTLKQCFLDYNSKDNFAAFEKDKFKKWYMSSDDVYYFICSDGIVKFTKDLDTDKLFE